MSDAPARCPVRPGEPCMLCQPGGPDNCGLVYLVMTDPDLRADLCRRTQALPDGDHDEPRADGARTAEAGSDPTG